MTTKIGTAANYLALLQELDTFLTATGHAWGVRFIGVGNGRLRGPGGTVGGYIGTATTVTETITITFTSATSADVVGSISGALGTATVGTDFVGSVIRFRLVAGGTAFQAGDYFTVNTGPKWTRHRLQGCPEALLRTSTYSGAASLFDDVTTTGGVSATTLPQSVTVQMGFVTPVRSFALWNGATIAQGPRDFVLEWSDNGSSWTTAQSYSAVVWAQARERKDFVVSVDPGAHLYWRIRITASNSGTSTQLTEVRLFADTGMAVDVSTRLEFAYSGPGVDGTKTVYFLGFTDTDNGTDRYNFGVRSIEFWHDMNTSIALLAGTSGTRYWHSAKSSINYWMVANGGRVMLVCRMSSVYTFTYCGHGLPYENPDNHPSPLIVGGQSGENSTRFDASNAFLRNPWDPPKRSTVLNGNPMCGMAAMMPGGTWVEFANRESSSNWTEGQAVSAATMTGKVWPWAQDPTGNNQPNDWRDALDGSKPIIPAVLFYPHTSDAGVHTWGEFDGVYWTTGFGATAEALLRDGAIDLLVVPNMARTGLNHFAAIALD